jgi:hypothetical protein
VAVHDANERLCGLADDYLAAVARVRSGAPSPAGAKGARRAQSPDDGGRRAALDRAALSSRIALLSGMSAVVQCAEIVSSFAGKAQHVLEFGDAYLSPSRPGDVSIGPTAGGAGMLTRRSFEFIAGARHVPDKLARRSVHLALTGGSHARAVCR